MPLKLKDINHPSSTGLVNKWADEKDQVVRQLQKDINQLRDQLQSTQK